MLTHPLPTPDPEGSKSRGQLTPPKFLEVWSAHELELALLAAALLNSWVDLSLSPSLLVLFTSGCEG